MTLYTVTFELPQEFAEKDLEYSYCVLGEDASDDSIEADYPDINTRPIPVLTIKNHATGGEELPDPMKIKAWRAAPDAG